MLTSFDAFLIALTIILLGLGMARRFSLWRTGQAEDRKGDAAGLIAYLLASKKILKRRLSGSAHLVLFWGVLFPLIVVVAAQFRPVLPQSVSKLLSLFLDLVGFTMLFGTVFLLGRRMRRREEDGPKRVILPVLILLVILLTGFLAEGERIAILREGFFWQSPFGSLLAAALPGSPLLMQFMIRFHFFVVLIFIASLPFTFMRHLVAASLNVFYKRETPSGELRKSDLEKQYPGAKEVTDFSWKQLLDAEACVACGRCDENCPATISEKPLSPRRVVRRVLEQMEAVGREGSKSPRLSLDHAISDDEIWSCTTCMACVEHCPIFVEPLDKIMDLRRYRVMGAAVLPSEAKPVIRNLEIYGDVYSRGIAHRTDWSFNRGVPLLSENTEILLWVGCAGAFHPRNQEAARAMVKILRAGEIPFGILGKEELCCGDPARRLGEESLFIDIARENIRRIQKHHFHKIVTLCPHCFNTLKNEYPSLGGRFQVVHGVEFVSELIREKKVSLKYGLPAKVSVHDPCYLGRGNGIYQPLREIMSSVPGVEYVELPRNRDKAFCCGGGGGRMWLHEKIGKRMNHLRAAEVASTGVDVLGTACPYCLTMLEDGIKALDTGKQARVMDVVEVIASSIR
jgi:Fe-S oxidoreductase/nitrate reductase gamma subunit